MCYQMRILLIFVIYFQKYDSVSIPWQKKVLEIKNLSPLGSTKIIYLTFSEYSRLHKLEHTQERRTTTDDRQNFRITDRQSFETCLKMVDFCLGPFFVNRKKNCLHRFTIKVNQKKHFNHITLFLLSFILFSLIEFEILSVKNTQAVEIRTFFLFFVCLQSPFKEIYS